MVRSALIALSALGLTGCNPALDRCEEIIKRELRSPATYERIEVLEYPDNDSEPPALSINIQYDAANAYGAPIRSRAICKVPLTDGKPVPSGARVPAFE